VVVSVEVVAYCDPAGEVSLAVEVVSVAAVVMAVLAEVVSAEDAAVVSVVEAVESVVVVSVLVVSVPETSAVIADTGANGSPSASALEAIVPSTNRAASVNANLT
jgi:hypothetical protein